jgi:hypothetical protein
VATPIDIHIGIGTLLWDNQSVSNIEALDNTVDSLLEYVASPILLHLLHLCCHLFALLLEIIQYLPKKWLLLF